MADEFLAFLLAGLFLLGTGLLFVSAITPTAPVEPEKTTVFETGFDVAYASERQAIDVGGKELFNGVFFGSNELEQHVEAEGLESLSVQFTVVGTNNLGPLEIKVNGKTAARGDFAAGDYSIDIGRELLSDKMDIELKPSSSLWKIWAPNMYRLKNVKLETKSLFFGKKESMFLLGGELDDFGEARLEFVMDENIGMMKVEVNDRQVFSDFLKNQHSIELAKTDLKKGENRIEIIPEKNSRFSGVARMVMFSKEAAAPQPQQEQARFRSLSMFEAADP